MQQCPLVPHITWLAAIALLAWACDDPGEPIPDRSIIPAAGACVGGESGLTPNRITVTMTELDSEAINRHPLIVEIGLNGNDIMSVDIEVRDSDRDRFAYERLWSTDVVDHLRDDRPNEFLLDGTFYIVEPSTEPGECNPRRVLDQTCAPFSLYTTRGICDWRLISRHPADGTVRSGAQLEVDIPLMPEHVQQFYPEYMQASPENPTILFRWRDEASIRALEAEYGEQDVGEVIGLDLLNRQGYYHFALTHPNAWRIDDATNRLTGLRGILFYGTINTVHSIVVNGEIRPIPDGGGFHTPIREGWIDPQGNQDVVIDYLF